MADLSTGYTFADGSGALTAARINTAIGGATILPAFITGKSAITIDVADYLVFYDTSGTVLGKTTLTNFITAIQGTTSGKVAAGNDSRFSANVAGIRKSTVGGSTDVAAKPPDYALAPTAGTLSAGAVTLDCSLNSRFTVAVTANAVITLTNIPDGGEVIVRTTQSGGFTCAFTTTQTKKWPAGAAGVISAGAAAIDEWRFTRWGNDLDVEIVKAYA